MGVKRQKRRRDLKLHPEIAEAITQSLIAGNTKEDAFAASGISSATVYRWLQIGRDAKEAKEKRGGVISEADKQFVDFHDLVESAQAHCRQRLITVISNDAIDDWHAAAWLLERLFPGKFGARVQLTIREELDAALDLLEQNLSPEEFRKVAGILSRLAGEG